jgi:hypothetical protein
MDETNGRKEGRKEKQEREAKKVVNCRRGKLQI